MLFSSYPPSSCLTFSDAYTSEHANGANLQEERYASLHSLPSKISPVTVTMMHTSIDGGFDEGCIGDDEYYFDGTNDQSWACSFGTSEEVR